MRSVLYSSRMESDYRRPLRTTLWSFASVILSSFFIFPFMPQLLRTMLDGPDGETGDALHYRFREFLFSTTGILGMVGLAISIVASMLFGFAVLHLLALSLRDAFRR